MPERVNYVNWSLGTLMGARMKLGKPRRTHTHTHGTGCTCYAVKLVENEGSGKSTWSQTFRTKKFIRNVAEWKFPFSLEFGKCNKSFRVPPVHLNILKEDRLDGDIVFMLFLQIDETWSVVAVHGAKNK